MAFIPGLVAGVIVVLSCYALVNSAQSIPKLQTYEGKAQTAAEWSSTAAARLRDTRKTVAVGFAMVRMFFFLPFLLLFSLFFLFLSLFSFLFFFCFHAPAKPTYLAPRADQRRRRVSIVRPVPHRHQTTVSLISGVAFLFLVPDGFSYQRVASAAGLCLGERLSSQYMHGFWADKHQIPFMDDYNDAIAETENVVKFSDALSVAWGFIAAFKLIGL